MTFPPMTQGNLDDNYITLRELEIYLAGWVPPAQRNIISAGTDEVATTTVNTTETIAHTKTITGLTPGAVITIDIMVGMQVATPTPGSQIEIRPAIEGTKYGVVAVQDTAKVESGTVSISGNTAIGAAHSHPFSGSVSGNTSQSGGVSNVTETTTGTSSGHTHTVPFGHQHPSNQHTFSDTFNGNTQTEGGGLGHSHSWSGQGSHTHGTDAPTKLRVTKRYVLQTEIPQDGELVLGAAVRYTGGTKTNQETDIQWIIWR